MNSDHHKLVNDQTVKRSAGAPARSRMLAHTADLINCFVSTVHVLKRGIHVWIWCKQFSGVGNSPKAATIDKDTMAGLARWAMAAPLSPFSGAVDTTETASRFASSILQLSLYNGRGLPNARN
jgi:hypothetical protein